MKVMVAAGSRSGSEFLLRLLDAFSPAGIGPLAKVHSARQSQGDFNPSYREFREKHDIAGFVRHHNVATLKIEDAGLDDDCDLLFEAFDDAIVLASYRPVEKVVNSHANIRPWGMSPEKVVGSWIKSLDFFQKAAMAGRMMLVPLNDRSRFDENAFARLLGQPVSDKATHFLANWPRVNDLRHQKAVSGDKSEIDTHITRAQLLQEFPEIEAAEKRYSELIDQCNA